MKTKYTQGPWTLRKNSRGEECGAVIGADGMLVATTGYRTSPLNDEDDANAQLIAAAPELLEALEAVLPLVKHTDDAGWDVMKTARDIVNKATGR